MRIETGAGNSTGGWVAYLSNAIIVHIERKNSSPRVYWCHGKNSLRRGHDCVAKLQFGKIRKGRSTMSLPPDGLGKGRQTRGGGTRRCEAVSSHVPEPPPNLVGLPLSHLDCAATYRRRRRLARNLAFGVWRRQTGGRCQAAKEAEDGSWTPMPV